MGVRTHCLRSPKWASLILFVAFLLASVGEPAYSILYSVTFVELALMLRQAHERADLIAELIFREIRDQRNDADQFYFDPNDDQYEVYIGVSPRGKHISLSESNELRIVEYCERIRRGKETSSFLNATGVSLMDQSDFAEAARMFEYAKAPDPFFLPSYLSLSIVYQNLGEYEKASTNLDELGNRFLTLREYDPNYMIVIPEDPVIRLHVAAIQETIRDTQLLDVQIQGREYMVLAHVTVTRSFVSEKAYLYAPPTFDMRPRAILFPFALEIPAPPDLDS